MVKNEEQPLSPPPEIAAKTAKLGLRLRVKKNVAAGVGKKNDVVLGEGT